MKTNIDYWEKIVSEPTPIYQKLFEAEKEYLQKKITQNSIVLDVGCGDGRNIKSILDITQNITGIDNDLQAIKDVQENLKNFAAIKIIHADATSLPFTDESFDFIIFLDTLVNLASDKIKALEELRRVLRKDGKIILSVYSEDALENRLVAYKRIGLPIKQIEDGKVIIDESPTYQSEQFSKEKIDTMVQTAGLKILECKKVGGLAYILELGK